MNVRDLIAALQKQGPEKSVYFRAGRKLYAITICGTNPHSALSVVELTNEEQNLKPNKR